MAALGSRRWFWPRRRAPRKPFRRDTWTRLTLERLEERCLPTFFGSFSQTVYSVVGDGRALQIAVLLSTSPVNGPVATTGGQHPVPLQIDFATSGVSAVPGTDYTGNTSGTLTFGASDWIESFPVQTIARTAPRGDRTVNLTLSVHTNGGMQLGYPSTSVLHITDPPPLPTVSFGSNNTQSVTEINGGTNQVSATIVVGGGVTPAFPMVVNWGAGVAGDTAQPGTDYQLAPPTQLTFNYPGNYPVTVNILDDNGSDARKTLTLWIDRIVLNGQLIGPSTDTITIYEPPVAQALVSLPTWTFQQNQSTVFSCPITLDRAPQTSVSVVLSETPGTAIPGTDYQQLAPQTVTFNAGETLKYVNISIYSNSNEPANVTFGVQLSSPTNATLGLSAATVTIIHVPTTLVQFSASNYFPYDTDRSVTLTVNLSQVYPQALTVYYDVNPRTATPSRDYNNPVSNQLQFAPGSLSQSFTVPILDDGAVESDETFVVTLSGLVPAQWAPAQAVALGAVSQAVVTVRETDSAVPKLAIDSITVPESIGTAQVNATLSRPYSMPFYFAYQTTDGGAFQPTDYARIPLTATEIDPPSTQATIGVSINNIDPYETPESFTINAQGATNTNFIYNAYSDMLNRGSDVGGYQSWSTILQNGGSRNSVALALAGSVEYMTGYVNQAYQRFFFRPADSGGTAYWTRQVLSLNHITLEALISKLAGSDEYFLSRARGDNSTFIQLIYLDILGRPFDTTGYNSWLGQLNSGAKTREQIALAFATSAEYFGNYVNAMYPRYLHRAADTTGYSYWTNQLINGLSRSETFIAGLVGSAEYFGNLSLQSSTGTVTIVADPIVTQPPDQRNFELDKVSLTITATGAHALSYSASGLPLGLGIDSSGVISGTVADTDAETNNGQYNVTVTVRDPQFSAQTNVQFKWTVLDTSAIQPTGFPDLALPDTCGCQRDLIATATGAPSSNDGPTSGFSSEAPVRYSDGVVQIDTSQDIASSGFGMAFGLDRTWTNGVGYATGQFNGSGMVDSEFPFVMQDLTGNHVAVISNGTNARFFDLDNGVYNPRYYLQEGFTDDTKNQEFILTDTTGQQLRFFDYNVSPASLRGRFKSITDPYGNVATVMDRTPAPNSEPTDIQRTVIANGHTTTESFLFSYNADGLLSGVTWRRQDDGGNWSAIRQVIYTYGGTHANAGDLQFVTVTNGAGLALATSYYRYFIPSDSDIATGYVHGLKFYVDPASYERLKSALGDPHSVNLSDDQIRSYATYAFQFDSSQRVSQIVIQGQGTYNYTYVASGNQVGYNSWGEKTVEQRSDGSKYVAYTNYAGEIMLLSFVKPAGTQAWNTFYKYDSAGRLIMTAEASAVNGFDDTKADLMNFATNGTSTYLNNNTGLIESTDYYPANPATKASNGSPGGVGGYEQDTKIQQGQNGAKITQSSTQYLGRTANNYTIYVPASDTVYPTANPNVDPQTTNYVYSWYSSFGVQSLKVTPPLVSTSVNGSGQPDTETSVFDTYGNEIWHKDADGYISSATYDVATGAILQSVQDVITTPLGNPLGWSTQRGGGLNLTTTAVVDALGRPTKVTDANGNITYYVYSDPNHEVLTYAGWNSSTHLPTTPTEVTRADWTNSYVETLTMTATPNLNGDGSPSGTEAIGNVQTLSRDYINKLGQVFETDDYFNLAGLTYSTATYIGSSANYYTTRYGFDGLGNQNRQVTPTGTITDTAYDSLGRVISTAVGTNDSTANNMVQVSSDIYDNGGVGDSNLTEEDTYTSATAAPRRSLFYYDWRDRLVAAKVGALPDPANETDGAHRPILYTTYDNLDEVLTQQQYDGDGVSISVVNGVPQPPASGLLRAESGAAYDDQGRVYQSYTYVVNQTTGALTSNVASQVWYDHRGNVIKTLDPGGLVQKFQYDGAGRETARYVVDGSADALGGGATTWKDAVNVSGNPVLSEVKTQYDADGNPILVTGLERNHDETALGPLGDAITTPKARVSYVAAYYDAVNRPTDQVDVGTNGGHAYSRPAVPDPASDIVRKTSETYNAAGWLATTTDPRGIVTQNYYDNLGRTVSSTQAVTTSMYSYDGDNHLLTYTAAANSQPQTTQYVYGVSPVQGSSISSNDILQAVLHPDKTSGAASWAQADSYQVDALGETTAATDRNGNVHAYTYDSLGRLTADAVTTLGNSDGSVRRIETAYDSAGNPYLYTSFDAAVGGNILNQVRQTYNGLGQLTAEYQSHSGAVNTSTTLSVQYAYTEANGQNNSRLTSMTYPNGRVLNYNYTGLDANISRLTSITEGSGSNRVTLESYKYLGLDTVVERDHPQINVNLTYLTQNGNPGDAGDQYVGLDRFGQVVDQNWVKTTNNTSTDHFKYAYDRDGNRLYRTNELNHVLDELYHASGANNGYDLLNQLTGFVRGQLSASSQGGVLDTVSSPSTTESWNLDALGNWSSVTSNASTQTRTANQQNEVTGVGSQTLVYDGNGNTVVDERGYQYFYDAWNRLTKVYNGGTLLAQYSYDALGRRIVENDGGVARDLYFSAAWQVVEERVSGVAKVQYVWSPVYVDALVERDRDPNNSGTLSERLYVQQDANWNVTALVSMTGQVVERYIYDPYGKVTVFDGNWGIPLGTAYAWNYLHQGGRFDWATGLYNFRFRDYSPTLGRWMQVDPVGFAAGNSNLYGFNFDTPGNLTDPTGLGSGIGHHWVPVSVLEEAYKNGKITEEAYHAGLGAFSGWLGHKHGFGEYGGVKHSAYNEEVRKLLDEWIETYGKLSGEKMVKFIQEIKTYHLRHPESVIGKFNTAITKCRDAWLAAGKNRGFRNAESLEIFVSRGKVILRRLKAWRIAKLAAKAGGSVLWKVAKKTGQVSRKGSKMVPGFGSIAAIVFWGFDVHAKGWEGGTINSVIDAIPVVGLLKGAMELGSGEEMIPDLEEELPPITEADIDEIDGPQVPDEEGSSPGGSKPGLSK